MVRKSTRRAWALYGVLLLGTEVSGFYLTLSNFQSVSALSLPLECLFAYNTPMQGCVAEDFGDDATCSLSCQRGVVRIQNSIKKSCSMVGAGEESLLNAAQNGNLVAAICRIADSPPESISTTDGAPSQILTQTSPVSRSDDVFSATTTKQVSPSSEPESQTLAASTSVPAFASSAATKTITSSTSIADDDGPTGSDTTATSRATSLPTQHQTTATSTLQAHSAITRSLSTSLTSSRAAAQIQPPRGGGGSPFDPLPESAAVRLSGGGRAYWLAVSGACVAGIYALLY